MSDLSPSDAERALHRIVTGQSRSAHPYFPTADDERIVSAYIRASHEEIERLTKTLREVVRERIRKSRRLTEAKIEWDKSIPVDDFRCPLCGNGVAWSLNGGPGDTSRARCLSSEGPIGEPDCGWTGTPIARFEDQGVYVLWPVQSGVDERLREHARKLAESKVVKS